MNTDLHFSRKSDEYATPDDVFRWLDAEYGPFTLDVAATAENAKCPTYFTREDDALSKDWPGRAYCNGPYSLTAQFVEHAIRQIRSGATELIVMLVPASTATVWWREAWEHADEVVALSGKLKFGDSPHPAPFASTVFVFRPRRRRSWPSPGGGRYCIPKRHGTRSRWFHLKMDGRPTS